MAQRTLNTYGEHVIPYSQSESDRAMLGTVIDIGKAKVATFRRALPHYSILDYLDVSDIVKWLGYPAFAPTLFNSGGNTGHAHKWPLLYVSRTYTEAVLVAYLSGSYTAARARPQPQ